MYNYGFRWQYYCFVYAYSPLFPASRARLFSPYWAGQDVCDGVDHIHGVALVAHLAVALIADACNWPMKFNCVTLLLNCTFVHFEFNTCAITHAPLLPAIAIACNMYKCHSSLMAYCYYYFRWMACMLWWVPYVNIINQHCVCSVELAFAEDLR